MGQLYSPTFDRGSFDRFRARLMPFRGLLLLVVDLAAWIVGYSVAVSNGRSVSLSVGQLLALSAVVIVLQGVLGRAYGMYGGRYRVGSYDEAMVVGGAWALVLAGVLAVGLVTDDAAASVVLVRSIAWSTVALTVMVAVRLVWRAAVEWALRPTLEGRSRAVVVGAGEAGYLIVRGMLTDTASASIPVALLDDDPAKARRSLMGVSVAGTVDELADVVRRFSATVVIIAVPSASSAMIGRVLELAKTTGVEVRTLPPMSELGSDTVRLSDVRPINENDLLGRAEVNVDLGQIRDYVTGKRVLVTGAGGSIGSELCRQLHHLLPARLVMLDRDESGLHATQLSIEGRALLDSPDLVVADIREHDRVDDVFARYKPDVVFHAAALKHLTLLESHPAEAVKTNVLGTRNVLDAAIAHGATCVVNVSTDKAADPTSVLGATKLLAEQVAAEAARQSGVRIVSVRFGNVLGSRGSVLPTFLHQIAAGGPVTVTHPEVTRFFMTIPEAVRLLLQAGAIGRSGEILILDMGQPVRIADMARRLIEYHNADVRIEFTGLRPGEKLHEVLVASNETGAQRIHPRIMHSCTEPMRDVGRLVDELAAHPEVEADALVRLASPRRHRLAS